MITSLSIKNYALIQDIQAPLDSGLTMITGETGAGKSILLGALALLLGKRADLSSVKNPSEKCIIEGVFNLKPYKLKTLFKKNDLDYEDQSILRREILPGGKSRSFVNDTPVVLSQLQAIAPFMVDVHSQHETGLLSTELFQLHVVDALANTEELLSSYSKQHGVYKEVVASLAQLEQEKAEALKELDYHSFLFNELQEAKLQGTDQLALEEHYQTLSHSEEIQEQFSRALQLLSEEQLGSLDSLKEVRTALGALRSYATSYDALWDRVNSVVLELEDVQEEVERENDSLETDPSQLMQLEQQLQTLYKLQQKHAVGSVQELIVLEEQLGEKVANSLNIDDRIEDMNNQVLQQKKETLKIAAEIHEKRVKVIPALKEKLEQLLTQLGLPNAQFQFELTTSSNFKPNGTDNLELLFTANKGMALGPIKKVASGGEMSRIMLAIKAVLAQYKKLPTLVFDEIDTGVSGEIALRMAGIMSAMSHTMQVISITHLPQIAAKGEQHIKVYKSDEEQGTVTHLKTLTEEERIVEIAQMIGGHQITEAAIANAKELLN